ncbi:MAG: metallophosphoesterase, partial [Chloroflexi bacterium]|nr:metallophosphoesterase [Chloroflexota bacterium]
MIKFFSRSLILVVLALLSVFPAFSQDDAEMAAEPTLLTDPFLQLPTEDSVRVVWFTEFEGESHFVTFGEGLDQTAEAETFKMSRMFEDQNSRVGEQTESGQVYSSVVERDIWRHEATVTGLTQGERVPYFVTSIVDGTEVVSGEFTLQPTPAPGQPMQILITSDHQLMPMTPANLQMVEETVGQVDAIFLAGDLQNIPDRASEWFDDNRGRAFFPGLQGNAAAPLERTLERDGITITTNTVYTGGELIQHAPLFPALGNHETMGRFIPANGISGQYGDPRTREWAEQRYEELAEIVNPTGDEAIREQWISDNSFNTITYEELFTLPEGPGGERYYAIQYGDVYLISLWATRIWRTPSLGDNARGKYREPEASLNLEDNWGEGEFLFSDLRPGSDQYNWLIEQLNSEAFQNARYKYVLLHHPMHSLGDNVVPAYTDPVRTIDYNEDGSIAAVRYEYPIEEDILIYDILPLLEDAGVNMIHYGHSHV